MTLAESVVRRPKDGVRSPQRDSRERAVADPAAVEQRLFTVRYHVAETPHIRLLDERLCRSCAQPCLWFCPAGVYQLEDGTLHIAYENCLECGTCRIACPQQNVLWHNPIGGAGIAYKRG